MELLRQAVINGAHKHPGALAVEDANGVVIQLSKLDEKVGVFFCGGGGAGFSSVDVG